MVGGAMVSASTGVMNSLLAKLGTFKEEKKVRVIKDELSAMEALLFKVATRDDPDVQASEWTRQVREVGYDSEDCIDIYVHPRTGKPERPAPRLLRRFLERRSSGREPEFSEQIEDLTKRIVDANERYNRYKLEKPDTNTREVDKEGPCSASIPPQLLYAEPCLVAIDEPTTKLAGHLMQDEQQLRVVSIHGSGGIGKTTLAKEVYRKLRGEFQRHAFVYAGRNNPLKTTLLEMLRQVSEGQQNILDMESKEEQDVIKQLRTSLEDKRYLIVIDDIFTPSAWKVIKCALPESKRGSRIITTTRVHDVAKSCSNRPIDVIHEVDRLGEGDSKEVLFSRVIGLEGKDQSCLDKIFDNTTSICEGMPLAIAVMAGLLSRKFSELGDWKKVEEYVTSALKQYPTMKGMRKILYLSYSDLALPVKTCLLYLSIFPKYHKIMKGRLIWRWAAEGFIPAGEGSVWKTGESYFNALVNTRLIQPVFVHGDDQPVGCTVHGVVLEFILSLSSKENFVTTDAELALAAPRDAIRRLSLDCSNQDDDILKSESYSMSLYQVRSLTLFRIAKWMKPHLKEFHLLRVLDLEDVEGLKDKHLVGALGKLFMLKYLGLGGGKHVTELPKDIGELQHLETLDVSRTSVRDLSAAVKLVKLARLLAADANVLPAEVDKMQELQEFSMISIGDKNSLECLAKVAALKRLRSLGVKWCFPDEGDSIEDHRSSFASSLGKLGASASSGSSIFESLFLDAAGDTSSLDFLVDSWAPPGALQKFMMISTNCYFRGVPTQMTSDICPSLTHLEIAIARLTDKDLKVLGDLPALVLLKLRCLGNTDSVSVTENSLAITADRGFQCLQVFCFGRQDGGLGFVFGEGAMAQLRKLQLYFKAGEEKKLGGVNRLSVSYLCQVHTIVDCDGAGDSAFKDAHETIKKFVSDHPNQPTLEITKHHNDNMVQLASSAARSGAQG